MVDVNKFFEVGASADGWWEYTPEDEDMVGFNQCQVPAPKQIAPPFIRQRGLNEEDDEVVTDPEAEAWFAAGINSGEEGALVEDVPQAPYKFDSSVKLSEENFMEDFVKADKAKFAAYNAFTEKETVRRAAKKAARVQDDA